MATDGRLRIGTRIRFARTLTEPADECSPATIFASEGERGVVTGHGTREGYWVLADGWRQRFGAAFGKDFDLLPSELEDPEILRSKISSDKLRAIHKLSTYRLLVHCSIAADPYEIAYGEYLVRNMTARDILQAFYAEFGSPTDRRYVIASELGIPVKELEQEHFAMLSFDEAVAQLAGASGIESGRFARHVFPGLVIGERAIEVNLQAKKQVLLRELEYLDKSIKRELEHAPKSVSALRQFIDAEWSGGEEGSESATGPV